MNKIKKIQTSGERFPSLAVDRRRSRAIQVAHIKGGKSRKESRNESGDSYATQSPPRSAIADRGKGAAIVPRISAPVCDLTDIRNCPETRGVQKQTRARGSARAALHRRSRYDVTVFQKPCHRCRQIFRCGRRVPGASSRTGLTVVRRCVSLFSATVLPCRPTLLPAHWCLPD